MPTELERVAFEWKHAGTPKPVKASAWPDLALFRLELRKHLTPRLPGAAARLNLLAQLVGDPCDELLELLWRTPEEELSTDPVPVWCLRRTTPHHGAVLFRGIHDLGQVVPSRAQRAGGTRPAPVRSGRLIEARPRRPAGVAVVRVVARRRARRAVRRR